MKTKMIGWFSGGVTSAVAIKKAIESGHEIDIYFMETGQHHEDNERFIQECAEWLGQKIHVLKNKKFKDAHDVCEKTGFINSPKGARCTKELKKDIRIAVQKFIEFDYQIFGYDSAELERAVLFKQQYPEAHPVFPLLELGWSKEMCLAFIQDAGIRVPKMYELGFNNNNCIGCVKGGMGYWNRIKVHFPDHFNRMARIERKIGRTCLRKEVDGKKVSVYLDELDPSAGRNEPLNLPECGITCSVEFMGMLKSPDIREITTGLFESATYMFT